MHKHLRRLERVWVDSPVYFITTCAHDRCRVLASPAVHRILRSEWETALRRHHWHIGNYVIMPDHVHFFAAPDTEGIGLSDFMQSWKEWTSKRIVRSLSLEPPLWQPEFFDHLLRSEESYTKKWNYVRDNPVREKLVERADDWPFSGCVEVLRM